MDTMALWQRYQQYLHADDQLGLRLDISRMRFDHRFFERMAEPLARALAEMAALERGEIANPDEGRMVGHYWLRAPELAPSPELGQAIVAARAKVQRFASDLLEGRLSPPGGDRFRHLLVLGIGGSALGPQLLADALGDRPADMPADPSADTPDGTAGDARGAFSVAAAGGLGSHFIDNTDPDGFDCTLRRLGGELAQTLTLTISKSGGTQETRNAMLEVRAAYQRAGLHFPAHAAAVTGDGSALARLATSEGWLGIFPMWDWVGGRTSVTSAVGLLPAALAGIDVDALLAGAAACDRATRVGDPRRNPAALLALMWWHAGAGAGRKDMVVLPYKDRLLLFSRYLQQLVMESLGKQLDRKGVPVHQGLVVYGNKGSTDQHAYVQQLRDGLDNFFVTFIQVLRDRQASGSSDGTAGGRSLAVAPDTTSGDALLAFLLGTRDALAERGRESLTLTLSEIGPRSLGVLIALFERAVGLYASLIDVNAYHQPGVEAGKRAAEDALSLQRRLLAVMRAAPGRLRDAAGWAEEIGASSRVETVLWLLEHAAANPDHGVRRQPGQDACAARFAVDGWQESPPQFR